MGCLFELLELGAAGNERGRARALRQEGPYLLCSGGIVQDYQDPSVGELITILLGSLAQLIADGAPSHPELMKELGQHVP